MARRQMANSSRRGQRHNYDWVLLGYRWIGDVLVPFLIDARSKKGRRAIARFHADAFWTLRSTAPRWYRRVFDHRLRSANNSTLQAIDATARPHPSTPVNERLNPTFSLCPRGNV
jgi:hypothetical protein